MNREEQQEEYVENPVAAQEMGDNEFQNLTYEQATGQLEQIIMKLERGNSSLEESLGLYQEGKKLLSWCNGRLSEVREKVLILSPQGAGGPPLEQEFHREGRE